MTSLVDRVPAGRRAVDAMQLETAVPTHSAAVPGTVSCERCRNRIDTDYHVIAGHVTCAACRDAVRRAIGAPPAVYATAVASGLGATLLTAALITYVVERRGYPMGVIALIAGYLITRAVEWGARGRRTHLLQAIALALTYLALGVGYLPFVLDRPLCQWAPGLLRRPLCVLAAPLLASTGHLPASLATAMIIVAALLPAWLMLRPARHGPIEGPLRLGGPALTTRTSDVATPTDSGSIPRCMVCGTELSRTLHSCPACHALLRADDVRALATSAATAEQQQDWTGALGAWRTTLGLLPRWSTQYETIASHICDLSGRLDARRGVLATAVGGGPGEGVAVALSRGVTAVWESAKLLVVGLTKLSTLGSLVLFVALYWAIAMHEFTHLPAPAQDRIAPFLGWPFAIGFVMSIYVHEMGHVAALARYGIRASAPVFLPGFGAFVRLQQRPATVREDGRIGLSGPLWGLGAALAAYGAFRVTHDPAWSALAQIGGLINLFNLVPVWQLDGARAFRALTRSHRWITVATAVVLCAAAWHAGARFLGQPLVPVLLAVFAVVAAGQAARAKRPVEPDYRTLLTLIGLVSALSWLAAG